MAHADSLNAIINLQNRNSQKHKHLCLPARPFKWKEFHQEANVSFGQHNSSNTSSPGKHSIPFASKCGDVVFVLCWEQIATDC